MTVSNEISKKVYFGLEYDNKFETKENTMNTQDKINT